jgi:formate hydrogenlyase subunit 3/multisubunit Na+/H+ antiporter MnhD subunit
VSFAEISLVAALATGAAAIAAALAIGEPRRRTLLTGVLTAGCGAGGLLAAMGVLATGRPVEAEFPHLLPFAGLSFRLDAFGAVFVLVAGGGASAAALYGISYTRDHLSGRSFQALVPAFVLTLLLVPAANSMSTFLMLWELMAVTSLLLVLAEQRRSPNAREAAMWYGVMTHLGFIALLLMFSLLAAHAADGSFAAIRHTSSTMAPALRSLVFLLALVGFGSKAGMVPLHAWLPRAHPEAPSHVSALMSAVMVNLGIYGLVRVGFGLLGGGPSWWWLVLLALGAVSALFGILHALASTDLKRMLAYSTTENMGLVLVGVAAAGLFTSTGHPVLAAAALGAVLLHVINHAAFKGLLFLAAGSVVRGTGERDLDQLGGLMRRMPVTGAMFTLGAVAITALPPLNGFMSEWLLLQSLIHGAQSHVVAVAVAVPVAIAVLALTTGLTAATFVKATGTGFLALPRTRAAEDAEESPRSMLLGMGVLAGACVFLAIAVGVLAGGLARAIAAVGGVTSPAPFRVHGTTVSLPWQIVGTSVVLGVAVVVGVVAISVALRVLPRGARRRRTENWGCGRTQQTARMEYTASSFAEPLVRVFDDVLHPELDIDVTHREESQYYVESISLQRGIKDAFEERVYRPVLGGVAAWGRWARQIQNGSVHRYLAYGFVALVLLLVAIR